MFSPPTKALLLLIGFLGVIFFSFSFFLFDSPTASPTSQILLKNLVRPFPTTEEAKKNLKNEIQKWKEIFCVEDLITNIENPIFVLPSLSYLPCSLTFKCKKDIIFYEALEWLQATMPGYLSIVRFSIKKEKEKVNFFRGTITFKWFYSLL